MINTTDLVQGIADDEEVKAQTKRLALAVLSEALDLVENGTPQSKHTIIRSLMPALAKGLTRGQESDEIQELRKQMAELLEEVRGPGDTSVKVSVTDAHGDQPHYTI